MKDDDRTLLYVALGLFAFQKLLESQTVKEATKKLQQGGANVYDLFHPSQRDHENDLPGHQLSRAAIREIARGVGFPDPVLDIAVAIALAESGGVPGALGDGGVSIGLWQINTRAHPQYTIEQMKDPIQNAQAAFKISHGGTNWKPWSVFKSGRYLNFMPK